MDGCFIGYFTELFQVQHLRDIIWHEGLIDLDETEVTDEEALFTYFKLYKSTECAVKHNFLYVERFCCDMFRLMHKEPSTGN
jgi:hypothetical protein